MIKEFDDDTIRSIFGHEAAEDDDIKRLKQLSNCIVPLKLPIPI